MILSQCLESCTALYLFSLLHLHGLRTVVPKWYSLYRPINKIGAALLIFICEALL